MLFLTLHFSSLRISGSSIEDCSRAARHVQNADDRNDE
jgi:hypothetical protein